MFFLTELCLATASMAWAFTFPNLGAGWFEKWEERFSRLARRRGLAVLVVGVAALVTRAAVLPVLPIPQPGVADEFAYLLAADTLAHGRLTNPTHPMWIHFETFAVIQHPTYASKYPPAQGLILAAGQVIGGHPFWGVWFSAGLMCAAICWMLQAWLPEGWALFGGFLAVMRLATFSYWANSYLGGAVAATGGALVLGALPRIRHSQRVRDALLMGLGLAVLANSRPYEGLVYSLPIMAALLVWMLSRARPDLRTLGRHVVVPLLSLLVLAACATGYYCWRVTGDFFRMPYQVSQQTYSPTGFFVWQSLKPAPEYHHPLMQKTIAFWDLDQYKFARSHPGVRALTVMTELWLFFVGPMLTIPLFILLAALPYRFSFRDIGDTSRFLLLVFCVTVLSLLLSIYLNEHYAAPLTGVIYALVLQAMRRIRPWRWRGQGTGLAVVRAIPVIWVALFLVRVLVPILHIPVAAPIWKVWGSPESLPSEREVIQSQLAKYDGGQLVLVRYAPDSDVQQPEWVFNNANIDSEKIVWAREMGSSQDEELIKYFNDRHVWLLEPNQMPPKLAPYPEPATPAVNNTP